MAGTQASTAGSSEQALARDAALARLGRARRWMLAGAAALTAGLAALVSVLLPGKSLGAGSHGVARTTSATSGITPSLPAPADAAQLGIQAPGQAPQSVPQPAPQPAAPAAQPAPGQSGGGGGAVVSGGS
jgi:hypothetical protein